MNTVIFDLDGTLADTSGDLIAAANACFTDLGHGALLDEEVDKLTAFHGGRAMLSLGFSRLGDVVQADVDREYPRLLEFYKEDIDTKTTLYPGAMAAVEMLKSKGFAVGICTNKPEALAELLLQRLGIRSAFQSMIGADTLAVRKPDPLPFVTAVTRAGGKVTSSVLVGDTITDAKTARAAGVPIILVGFGPEGDAVARMQPDAVLPSYDQLGTVVAKLLRLET